MLNRALFVAFSIALLACPAVAGVTEAFAKGQADGKSFGERTGRNKGQANGTAQGEADGFKKGYEDARTQAPAPTPSPSEPPPEPTPSPEPPPSDPPPSAPPSDPPPSDPPPSTPPSDAPPAPPSDAPPAPPSDAPPAPPSDAPPAPPSDAPPAPPSDAPVPPPAPTESPVPADPPAPPGDVPPPRPNEPDVPAPGQAVHRAAPAVAPTGPGTADPDAPSKVERPAVGTDGIPLTGKLIDGDAWQLGKASMIAGAFAEESPEAKALQEYPDLIAPRAPDASPIPGLTPEETAYGVDYTKGFALGYAEAYAKAYAAAREGAYGPAWQAGYVKGVNEYRRLSAGSPAEAIDLARKAMLVGRFEEAVNRLDILIAGEASTSVLDAALYWKAACYYYWGKADRAAEAARRVTEMAGSQYADDAYFLLGACFEGMKSGGFLGLGGKRHFGEAATHFEIAATKFPGSAIVPEALLHLGACRERLRDRGAAIAAYERVVSEFAATPQAVKAAARLKALR